MSNPTTPFSWQMPQSTDLVTDLPADFEVFGQAVATSMADLLGGTTGQVLSKTTNADMDFTWIANDQGDITGVTAGTGISGGGTSGTVTVSIDTSITADLTTAQTLTTKTLTAPKINLAFNAQTGTTYTLVLGDLNKLVTLSNAASITLTVPPSVYSANDVVNIQQIGAGQVTFAAGSGVVITSTGGAVAAPKLRTQYSSASLICSVGGATPSFTVIGDIT